MAGDMRERSATIQSELDFVETKLGRAPYLTQFIQAPYPRPMPQVNLATAGHVYRSFESFAHKVNKNKILNILF